MIGSTRINYLIDGQDELEEFLMFINNDCK